MTHAGRGLAQPQSLSRLIVGELLEVAEQDDFTVNIVKVVEGHLEMALQLSPQRSAAGVRAGSQRRAARSSEDRSAADSEPPFQARGRSRSRLRLPALRCLRWASITWS